MQRLFGLLVSHSTAFSGLLSNKLGLEGGALPPRNNGSAGGCYAANLLWDGRRAER